MIKFISKIILVASLASFLTGTLTAQDPAPFITVRIIEVIPGKTDEFVDLQRTFTEALKKAGLPGRSIWQQARGNTNTFHIVSDSENYAELDSSGQSAMSDAAWATWRSRMGDVIQSRRVLTLQTISGAYIKSDDEEGPNLVRLNYVTLASRSDRRAYTRWLTRKHTPAFRKVGVTGRSAYRVVFGDNNNTVVISSRLSSWAQLDEPYALSSLSDDESTEVFEDLSEIDVDETRSLILRYRANLSFESP